MGATERDVWAAAFAAVRSKGLRVRTGEYEEVIGAAGHVRRTGSRPVSDIARDLRNALREAVGDDFSTEWWHFDKTARWPGQDEILVGAVEGSNEGYLLRILARSPDPRDGLGGTYTPVITVKLLHDHATAWDYARLVDMILTA